MLWWTALSSRRSSGLHTQKKWNGIWYFSQLHPKKLRYSGVYRFSQRFISWSFVVILLRCWFGASLIRRNCWKLCRNSDTAWKTLRQVMAWLLSDVTHCRQGWPLWYITIKYPQQRDLSWKLLDWIFHLNILCKHSILPLQTFQERAPKHTVWSSCKRITGARFIVFFFNFRSLHQLTSSVSPVHQYAMPGPGQMLTLEMMNLYHLDAWLIRPATQAKGCRLPAWESPMSTRWLQSVDWHLAGFNPKNWSRIIKETSFPTVIQPNRQRWVQSVQYSLHVGFLFHHGHQEHDCSMVELLATKPQTPQWFISHWYLGLIRPLWGVELEDLCQKWWQKGVIEDEQWPKSVWWVL